MQAYSRLSQVLKERRLSIPELHRRIRKSGLIVNVKSLYRLSDEEQPVERLDLRIAGAICRACSVPLSDWIVFEEEDTRLQRLPERRQVRLDALMDRNDAGTLTSEERSELQDLVREAEAITLSNARLLAAQRRRLIPSQHERADSAP